MRHMAFERPAGSPPWTPFTPVSVSSVRSRTTPRRRSSRRNLRPLAACCRRSPRRACRAFPCPACLPGALHRLAPLQLDDAAHDVGRALGRLHEAERPPRLARGHVRVADEHPVGHAAAADGQPLLLRGAPPLRRVARENPLARAVAGHARAYAERVRGALGVADVDGGPQLTVVRLRPLGGRACRAGHQGFAALAPLGAQRRVFRDDDAGRELRRRVGSGGEIGGERRRHRQEGGGAGDQNRWGGKSWHYACYIGYASASLERGRLEFVMNSRPARS